MTHNNPDTTVVVTLKLVGELGKPIHATIRRHGNVEIDPKRDMTTTDVELINDFAQLAQHYNDAWKDKDANHDS